MGKDLRYAIRVLLKKPGFALIAILTVATGIAANATIFSLVYGVLLKPLPVPHPDRLQDLWTSYPASNNEPDIFSPANYLDVAARTQTLAAVAGYDRFSFTLTGQGDPETVSGMRATASMAGVLAIEPQKGRWFTRAEDEDGHTVVLVSDSFWRNRLAADPHVLGRSLILNGKPCTIIGVLPPRIAFRRRSRSSMYPSVSRPP
jgi:putative ABC transport system permease protein